MRESKEFIAFQKWFTFYQKKLRLNNYKVYFKYEPLKDVFADIDIDQNGMVATVRLNSALTDKDKPFKNPKNHALHECIHLLLGRLSTRAQARYVAACEIYEAEEELVRRIETLLE